MTFAVIKLKELDKHAGSANPTVESSNEKYLELTPIEEVYPENMTYR